MYRPRACRQIILRTYRSSVLSKTSLNFKPACLQSQQSRAFSVIKEVKIDKSSNFKTKKKKRGDKSKPLQSPDVAKEREIQDLQQEVRFYHQQGAYDRALEASNTLLQTTEDHFGKDHPATASAYNNVGLMHKLLGNYKEACSHYHQALRSYGLILGKDHASYAAALHNLGVLLKSQVMLDEELTAMERLTLTEEAIQHLEEAFTIRQVELGEEHPHTVASQSALGSTIASQLLALQAQQQDNEQNWKPSKMTLQRWQAAERYLRQALDTAVQNPRGIRLEDDDAKKAFRNITTLSAAAAAQNLAVILKTQASLQSPKNEKVLEEAKQLYEQALAVRTTLLHEAHPDTIATKHSLAELIATIGDEESANDMRQEIMNAYNITEMDDENGESGGGERNRNESDVDKEK